ncbi:hypothetical protein [Pseudoalteromonas galatheae]|uniref:hypothetical protein n=1 Tax=Pseudoalteromonas galatheae TaxID=579562 RepID=UPI0030CC53B6
MTNPSSSCCSEDSKKADTTLKNITITLGIAAVMGIASFMFNSNADTREIRTLLENSNTVLNELKTVIDDVNRNSYKTRERVSVVEGKVINMQERLQKLEQRVE